MSNTSAIKKIEFESLPPKIRRQAQQRLIFIQAQRAYIQSRAPLISNRGYWQRIAEEFETYKLNDHALDPHINVFLNGLDNPAKSIIEFGCGSGRTAAILEHRGFRNYTGIDIAERAIEMARGRLSNMEFEVGDILTYGSKRKFDAAIATDVLLYLSPENQIIALLNLSRVLKKGAPILLRWITGENNILIKPIKIVFWSDGFEIEREIDEAWLFLASEEYIRQILNITGFSLTKPILRETVTIYKGTECEGDQDYLINFARKKST